MKFDVEMSFSKNIRFIVDSNSIEEARVKANETISQRYRLINVKDMELNYLLALPLEE